MSPNEPLPIFLPSLNLLPTRSSIPRKKQKIIISYSKTLLTLSIKTVPPVSAKKFASINWQPYHSWFGCKKTQLTRCTTSTTTRSLWWFWWGSTSAQCCHTSIILQNFTTTLRTSTKRRHPIFARAFTPRCRFFLILLIFTFPGEYHRYGITVSNVIIPYLIQNRPVIYKIATTDNFSFKTEWNDIKQARKMLNIKLPNKLKFSYSITGKFLHFSLEGYNNFNKFSKTKGTKKLISVCILSYNFPKNY